MNFDLFYVDIKFELLLNFFFHRDLIIWFQKKFRNFFFITKIKYHIYFVSSYEHILLFQEFQISSVLQFIFLYSFKKKFGLGWYAHWKKLTFQLLFRFLNGFELNSIIYRKINFTLISRFHFRTIPNIFLNKLWVNIFLHIKMSKNRKYFYKCIWNYMIHFEIWT